MKITELVGKKPSYILLEGGNAFQGVGAIHIDEIEPTLNRIESEVKLDNIQTRVLGSTGKKPYSGDIDIAVEPKSKEDVVEFIESLKAIYGDTGVRKLGQLITTKVPIENFNPENDERQPRTGFVQVDYIFGDPRWLQFFYHSPYQHESKFKGTDRNIMISMLAGYTNRQESDQVEGELASDPNNEDRPVEVYRYKWSSKDGLLPIKRYSKINKRTGKYNKKQADEMIGEPTKDPAQIAEILFKGTAGPEAFNSAESIIDAAKNIFSGEELEDFYKHAARSFILTNGSKFNIEDYPLEIQKYIELPQEQAPVV